ncbi:MAG: AfsR/SARP family transcriptional regulator, partial [Acidimicrobiia bacterium]|nr:AfsR/SARP family transcriptional regulator [Acidimicrobiia bacterium]
MEYRVLGALEAFGPDGRPAGLGGPKQRAVLACLLANYNQAVSSDKLIDAVWGDTTPADPKSALQTYVSRLRKLLGEDSIGARGSGYLLRVGPDDVDALVFERLVHEAGSALDRRNHAAAIERYEHGLALWRGDAYADFMYADFARGESERLEELRRTAIENRLQVLLDQGRHREALPDLEQALAEEPLRERLWALYMVAL